MTVLYRVCLLLTLITTATSETLRAGDSPAFSRDIQPLLSKHCVVCHGPDEAEAGLRLDLPEAAYAELDSGARAVVPGKPDQSELLRRVATTDEAERMPPEGDPLSAAEIETLRNWVADGARFEQHWAYQPVQKPALPDTGDADWAKNPVDFFVLAQLETAGVEPSPEADRTTLIKRLYYDLLGLPPGPEEVDAFVADEAPDAFESLVDRLLQSKHFGERWGRHWLDKARYADSDGYEKDRPRPNAWRYRDWVIDAINRDLPFDQFTVEQLAGDLLPDATPMQKLATAFHRQTLTNTEGGTDQEQFRVEATFDRTETTGGVWMALTLTCARCHTHKYDQITQREYYELFAFFNNANEDNIDVSRGDAAMAQYHRDLEAHRQKVADIQQKYADAEADLGPAVESWLQATKPVVESGAAGVIEFQQLHLVDAKSAGKAKLKLQEDDSLLATGTVADKDEYTLVFELPSQPVTGIRIEALAHKDLPNQGPGRAPNGNFVLSQLRAYVSDTQDFKSHTQIQFGNTEASFAQDKFSPDGALQKDGKTGWAVAPQTGKSHQVTAYTSRPVPARDAKYLQVVLDQQYGGKHLLGCFRVSALTGFDPLKALSPQLIEAVRAEAADRTEDQQNLIKDFVASVTPSTAELAASLATFKKQEPKPPLMPVRVIVPAERETKVLHRGDFLQPADEVSSGALAVVSRTHPLQSRHEDKPADRLDLALWLVDPHHPLTSRVVVNQVWTHLFGVGIVPTLNDFGVRGDLPTHPELLDWLAWEFPREMSWSRKALIKTIVTSATWRQSSHHRPDLQESDPTNRLLARQNRVRVEAEVVRDLNLAASGLLSDKVGGPSVFPPLPPGVAELSYANNFKWKTSKGADGYRRGMYTFFKRTAPHPTLVSFDCPDSNTTRLQRESSNTPLQALVTLNNEVYSEAAQALARRALTEGGDDDRARLKHALRLCIARVPDASEIDRFAALLQSSRDYYAAHAEEAEKLTSRHPVDGIAVEENAAWVTTVRIMLNLDEFIVRD